MGEFPTLFAYLFSLRAGLIGRVWLSVTVMLRKNVSVENRIVLDSSEERLKLISEEWTIFTSTHWVSQRKSKRWV